MRLLRVVVVGALLAGAGLSLASGPDAVRAQDEKKIAEEIIGCSETKVFHRADCKWTKAIEKAGTKVAFKNRSEAIHAGYRACGDCKP